MAGRLPQERHNLPPDDLDKARAPMPSSPRQGRGSLVMTVVGTVFTWIDSWTAPYEVMILAAMVAGILSWTLRTSR